MLAWVDVETTGLEPHDNSLLEVALLVTTDDLQPVDAGISLVVKPLFSTLEKMDDYVRRMHTDNNLLVECQAEETQRRYEVEEKLIAYLHPHIISTARPMIEQGKKPPMAGSSVHFDRAWLKVHMPDLERLFGYRNVDVSTIYELALRWMPGAAVNSKVEGPHRAMPDVLNSIEHLRKYRAALFNPKTIREDA